MWGPKDFFVVPCLFIHKHQFNMATFRLFLFALILTLPITAGAIGNYKAGDLLYVYAGNGLVLRQTAAPTGQKIATLPFGSVVTVLAERLRQVPMSVTEFQGFAIKGYWVKVRTRNGKEGFVFDGYLSQYPLPGLLPNDNDPNDPEGTMSLPERYLMLHANMIGARKDLELYENSYFHYLQKYDNGDEVQALAGEGGSSYVIRFHQGITQEEAYLIGRELWFGMGPSYRSSIVKGVITLLSEDELTQVEVRVVNGRTELKMSYAD